MNKKNILFPCIKIDQPLGTFYIGSIDSKSLCELTWVDVRRIEGERKFESYLGIQRPLKESRVKDLSKYVNSSDACFPTAVILAVSPECCEFNEDNRTMVLSEYIHENEEESIPFNQIAKVIDGQHRIEGLKQFVGNEFNINVSIFVDMDIADQAYLFSTVNLAQTKVNKSLVYDLFDLAKTRSPQKTCHNIAVALDKNENSPFYKRIKRLGVSTEGRFNETITQATFVSSTIKYISSDPLTDRNLYLDDKEPKYVFDKELERLFFRNIFIDKKDLEITDIIWNYFDAVKERWPVAWNSFGQGIMLNKTNGFKAFMRFLKYAYLYISSPGDVPSKDEFLTILRRINMQDSDFNTDAFKPGSSGESALYNKLCELSNLPTI